MIKILIAEDEESISNLMRVSLVKAGYLCECAFEIMELLARGESVLRCYNKVNTIL